MIQNLEKEVSTLKKLIEMLYKILYYLEIPTFKRDKQNLYNILLKSLTSSEKHMVDKNNTIFSLFRDHCINTLNIYDNYDKYSNDKIKIEKK